MKRIVVDVFLPAAGAHYDVRLPRAMNSLMAANLTARALARLSEGSYAPSETSVFAFAGSGRLLDANRSLAQENVENGSALLLI